MNRQQFDSLQIGDEVENIENGDRWTVDGYEGFPPQMLSGHSDAEYVSLVHGEYGTIDLYSDDLNRWRTV